MNQPTLSRFLDEKLAERKAQHLYRQRYLVTHNTDGVIESADSHYLDFASNDYLGLRNDPDVLQAWVNGLAQFGGGSGASPLVNGYYEAHNVLEQTLARLLKRDAALLFSSGFAANQALCRALFSEGGVIVADKLMHASFIDGASSSNAKFTRFKHNDCESLQSQIQRVNRDGHNKYPRLIATEGIFSMDGDSPPVNDMVAIAQEHDYALMIDDAHGLGVLGEDGMGTVSAYTLKQSQAPIIMATFGKALGTGGAFIAGSQALIDFLVNFARDYIYSTAFPPAQAIATLAAIEKMQQCGLPAALHENVLYFRQRAMSKGIPLMKSNSAIQLVVLGCPDKALSLGAALRARGIWCGVMRSPTVPRGTDRVRITLRANHHKSDIDALVDALVLSME
ncbi:8-amino-7-oxononanoate synthase [Alteromonas sediminis]|uniref:8-amino-7-oxononanoate synthase n=1 Tax=Alteromonas sediminis TaxID=2259342 RepID=A0A3N5Y3J2_9ALTE|nr:8-amino-7-oxononanoate synthase [Alteromonas sediminis]RPJ68617.1 8-amino-7-oxononanoate synthase [Alteromonas sediminis]